MSGGTGLALYRILQESLSNAARHAPDSEVRVRLDYGSRMVFLAVINGPSPAGVVAVENTGGHGVTGMIDRARGAAGWPDTRVLPEGGFEVVARLPVDPFSGATTST